MNCVSWYEAFTFCAWDGGWLPTEAEWNYAAAGGAEQRYYPWSSPATNIAINKYYAVYDCMGDYSDPEDCGFSDILSVGSRSPTGDGLWAQADLGGSMWEWNLDWYDIYTNPCNNCANLSSASGRVTRGGSWSGLASGLRAADRNYGIAPTSRYLNLGFRCARTP
jgi:formylglycine-generating enzyme required for sulfatase activity